MTLEEQLIAVAKSLKIQFTLDDKPISYSEVFSDTGMLPAIAKRADQLALLCLGYGIGAVFEEDEKAKVGARVKFDDITPNSLRLMFLVDVIEELRRSSGSAAGVVAVDEFLYD